MNEHKPAGSARTASLFRNGRNQAIRIPVEFELPGTEVLISKDGDRLVIEPKARANEKSWREILAGWEPLGPDDEFPDVDKDLPPLRDVTL